MEAFLLEQAKQLGAHNAAIIPLNKVPFRREFREACKQNSCGFFGRCWMCPPDVGDIDDMIARAQTYRWAFVFQSVGQLEDSFDIAGMGEAARKHNQMAEELAGLALPVMGKRVIRMGAGACHICERCAKQDNLPCRYPNRALASLESYGIAVSELAALCGMKYIHGANTVTYFGAFLYGEGFL